VVTGGGSKSAKWRQLVADICNLPVTVYQQDEGAAFGAALQALQIIEPGAAMPDVTDAHLTRDEERCCEPRREAVKHYEDAYRGYQEAVDAAISLYS
jgi:xylulokinase